MAGERFSTDSGETRSHRRMTLFERLANSILPLRALVATRPREKTAALFEFPFPALTNHFYRETSPSCYLRGVAVIAVGLGAESESVWKMRLRREPLR
jgi:hypothetical protein